MTADPFRSPGTGHGRRQRSRLGLALLVVAGVGLSSCGAAQALSLRAAERLGPSVHGRPGSSSWCTGVVRTADSLVGLGQGESLGIAARIVRNDVQRLASARAHLDDRSVASALQGAERTAGRALSELRSGREAGVTEAARAAVLVTRALTRLRPASGSAC